MLVADTSALCSLASAEVAALAAEEFEIHTTATVRAELRETATYDDRQAAAADRALDALEAIEVHEIDGEPVTSARIDAGEGSCLRLVESLAAEYLLTDDLRARPELEAATDATVIISPFVLAALVRRGRLERSTADDRLATMAAERSWLGTPIYERARRLLADE